MPVSLQHWLKRWRDNKYVSILLADTTRPFHRFFTATARQLEMKVHRDGATLKLPNGKCLRIASGTSVAISSAVFWHGLDGVESHTSATLRFFFERSQTFIDVGANVGFYSLLAALWSPTIQVVAFEPVPQIFSSLLRNVRLNRLDDRIRCENTALSSQSGTATLLLPLSNGADPETTGTLVADGWQSRQNSARLQVKSERFDDYEQRSPMKVDLVKIDVEDFEADVLAGMRATLLRDRPFIVCEVLPRPHQNARTLAAVRSLGYEPYWITPEGYIRVSDFAFHRPYCDFLFSPVSTPEVVLTDLNTLWTMREQDAARHAERHVPAN